VSGFAVTQAHLQALNLWLAMTVVGQKRAFYNEEVGCVILSLFNLYT